MSLRVNAYLLNLKRISFTEKNSWFSLGTDGQIVLWSSFSIIKNQSNHNKETLRFKNKCRVSKEKLWIIHLGSKSVNKISPEGFKWWFCWRNKGTGCAGKFLLVPARLAA